MYTTQAQASSTGVERRAQADVGRRPKAGEGSSEGEGGTEEGERHIAGRVVAKETETETETGRYTSTKHERPAGPPTRPQAPEARLKARPKEGSSGRNQLGEKRAGQQATRRHNHNKRHNAARGNQRRLACPARQLRYCYTEIKQGSF